MEDEYIIKQIITVLEKIRPFLNRDGGDIEYVGYKDGEVFVRMIGACAGCDLLENTLQDGVATLLKDRGIRWSISCLICRSAPSFSL